MSIPAAPGRFQPRLDGRAGLLTLTHRRQGDRLLIMGIGVIGVDLERAIQPLDRLFVAADFAVLHRDAVGAEGVGRVLLVKPHQLVQSIAHADEYNTPPPRAVCPGGHTSVMSSPDTRLEQRMATRFPQIYQQKTPTFSFEFFPPRTEAAQQRLRDNVTELKALGPTFVTCTYGAGGSTREKTGQIVAELGRELGVPAAAHLTCVGNSREQLIEVLEGFRELGITNIVALRGDAPAASASGGASGGVGQFEPHPEGLRYANELVALIRERFGDAFGIAVAGYPEGHVETPCRLTDMDNLKRKVDAGADVVMTQLFFDNRDFYDFVERCELAHIAVPIVAGIMPIVTRAGILKMAGLCGARLPSKLLKKLQAAGDDDEKVSRIGIDWATQQCHDLLEHHVRGIHFYTLNRSNATIEIYRRLGAADSQTLADIAGEG